MNKTFVIIAMFFCLAAHVRRQLSHLHNSFETHISSFTAYNGMCDHKQVWKLDHEHRRKLSAQIDSRRGKRRRSSSDNLEADHVDGGGSTGVRLPRDVLVVVPGLGEASRIDTLVRSIETIFKTLKSEQNGFSCVVYVYNWSVLLEAEKRLRHVCQIHFSEGRWAHHMKRLPSPLPESKTHVAVLMEDMDVSDIDLSGFLTVMDWSKFGLASPMIKSPFHRSMEGRCRCLYHRTDFVNIMFTVFTREVWKCWHHHIDTVNNPFGWGMDVTVNTLCNTSSGIIDVYEAYHERVKLSAAATQSKKFSLRAVPTPPPPLLPLQHQNLQAQAHRQMLQWITNKTAAKDPQRSYECAVLHKPYKAFDQCLMYWDGSEAASSTGTSSVTTHDNSVTVDWDCFRGDNNLFKTSAV